MTIKSLWKKLQGPKIYIDVAVDHIEMAEDYLMLGLELEWHNQTANSLDVREVQLRLFRKGRQKESINFYFQGHFAHLPNQRVIKKIIGEKSFTIPGGKSHLESIRFFTREILDLEEGTHPVEIHAKVAEGTYVHQADLQIVRRFKYRTSEAWVPVDLEENLIRAGGLES